MDFINKIYNSEYFVIGLFILIGILAAIFIILVFSGRKKKDPVEAKSDDSNVSTNDLTKNLETINNVATSETALAAQPNLDSVQAENNLQPSFTNSTDTTNIVQPVENTQPVYNEPVINNNSMDMMSFGQEAINNNVVPETIEVTPINPELIVPNVDPMNPIVDPTMPTVEPEVNDNLFNTSIFHGMPNELNNVENPVTEEPAIENQNDLTANLFQPVPDLDTVPVEIPVNNNDSINNDMLNFDLPTMSKADLTMPTSEPEVKSVDIPTIPTSEGVQMPRMEENVANNEQPKFSSMPTQFSSVYVNKEEPKVEPVNPAVNVQNDIPPYDPTLFTSILNTNNNVTPNVETTPVPNVNTVENTPVNDVPTFELPTINNQTMPTMDSIVPEVPALEPLPEMEMPNLNNEMPTVNPNNTFDFSMPSLATNEPVQPMTTETTNNSDNNNSGFPNFSSETYDIK